MINGPILHEMVRSIARERRRVADARFHDPRVVTQRNATGIPARLARVWGVLWHPATTITRGRRHHVLLQHEKHEGW